MKNWHIDLLFFGVHQLYSFSGQFLTDYLALVSKKQFAELVGHMHAILSLKDIWIEFCVNYSAWVLPMLTVLTLDSEKKQQLSRAFFEATRRPMAVLLLLRTLEDANEDPKVLPSASLSLLIAQLEALISETD